MKSLAELPLIGLIGTMTIMAGLIVPPTVVKMTADRELVYTYESEKTQHALLALLSSESADKTTYETIGTNYILNKPTNGAIKSQFEKLVGTDNYYISIGIEPRELPAEPPEEEAPPPEEEAPPTPTLSLCRGSGFVKVAGTKLTLNDGEFKFIGVNAHWMASEFSDEYTAQDMENFVKYLSGSCGTTIIRVFNGPNMDALLNLGKKYNVKFLIVLDDFVNNRFKVENPTYWFDEGYKINYLEGAIDSNWRQGVIDFVSAPNHKNNDVIFAWELANEPTCDKNQNQGCYDAFYNFVKDMSKAIKSADPNHLISIGVVGSLTPGATIDDGSYRRLHSISTVDLVTSHYYPDAYRPLSDESKYYQLQELKIANQLNKPYFLGEVGIVTYHKSDGFTPNEFICSNCQPCANVNQIRKSEAYKSDIDSFFSKGADGFLVWQFSPKLHEGWCDDFSFYQDESTFCNALKEKSNEVCGITQNGQSTTGTSILTGYATIPPGGILSEPKPTNVVFNTVFVLPYNKDSLVKIIGIGVT
ncbi:MAG: cellulase family glycosylhydrolase [Candidatus Aenigmarchaeota archaeon]|nr:cellulase family glycosylhydrolase [Candidatus Aenigmarchaeota archaeon]